MTFTEDDDRPVLESLGFGTPAEITAATSEPSASALTPFRRETPQVADEAPLTRRELRERERSLDATDAAPRASANRKPRARLKPRRTAKNTTRRDAVRGAARSKTIGARLLSFGAMLFAGALALGMSLPANAFRGPTEVPLAETFAMGAQTAEVDPTLVSFAERDAWTVTSWAEMLRLRYGNRTWDYTIGTGPVRWPFPYSVPISSGFGDRAAPCRGCSTVHSGLDFNPGAGAPIYAVADGTVFEVSNGGGSWGTYVMIQHQIDGQTVYSGYAHMQSSSTPLAVGQEIKVGDFVGLVGSTGQSTGAHLHFTISIGDRNAFVDPFTFLKRYAT